MNRNVLMKAVAGRENGVDLVFTTNTETGKTTELDKESHVNMSFYNGLNVSLAISRVNKG
jgi:pyridoxine/pyridoxamine 5'-phosphate oxidase